MKRSLHPGAIAAIAAVFVIALGAAFFSFGDREAAKSGTASPYTRIGDKPTSPGSGVNSLTGEPLSDTAKAYEAASYTQNSAPPGGASTDRR
ncbi:hypothetical protein EON81_09065 [bacterium]|nr:MAG: hypothetical protein EON81_09065 [bacterium]